MRKLDLSIIIPELDHGKYEIYEDGGVFSYHSNRFIGNGKIVCIDNKNMMVARLLYKAFVGTLDDEEYVYTICRDRGVVVGNLKKLPPTDWANILVNGVNKGCGREELAEALGVSPTTVSVYLRKLNINLHARHQYVVTVGGVETTYNSARNTAKALGIGLGTVVNYCHQVYATKAKGRKDWSVEQYRVQYELVG